MSAIPLIPRIRTALFEVINTAPSESSRLVLWTLCALFAVLLAWAILVSIDIVAVAEGRLVPETYVKIVQPADGGIVRELRVVEGQSVRRGDLLIRLDPTLASADQQAAVAQFNLKRLQIRRIDAQLAGGTLEAQPGDDPILLSQVRSDGNARARTYQDELSQQEAARAQDEAELTAAREALDKLERTLPSYMRTASAYERLASEHLVGALDAEARRREALEHDQDRKSQAAHVASLESSLHSQERKLAQIKSNYRSTLLGERSQLLGEVNQLAQELRKQGFREGLLELRAPEDGVVKDVATTTLGAVVQPGVVLLTLVPKDEPLRAEVYIRNEDVGFVKEGQPVRIKLAAYPFTKYGFLEGVVKTLAADASGAGAGTKARESVPTGGATDEPSVFRAIVELKGQTLRAPGVDLPIFAGMAVQAEINEGQRTVLEYLLSPIRTIADEAGGER